MGMRLKTKLSFGLGFLFVVIVTFGILSLYYINRLGSDTEKVLAQFAKAGIDVDALAAQLQDEGAKSFVKSWDDLMGVIDMKSAALKKAS